MKHRKINKILFLIATTLIVIVLLFICLFTNYLGKPKFICVLPYDSSHYKIYSTSDVRNISINGMENSDFTLNKIKYCLHLENFIYIGSDDSKNRSDISFLNNCKENNPDLKKLTLSGFCDNVEILSDCSHVESLHLWIYNFTDTGLISDFTHLKELNLCTNENLKCDGLKSLKNCNTLWISANSINMNCISQMDMLEEIIFSYIKNIYNYEDIRDLNKLKKVTFYKMNLNVNQIEILSCLDDLNSVVVDQCEISGSSEDLNKIKNKFIDKGISISIT